MWWYLLGQFKWDIAHKKKNKSKYERSKLLMLIYFLYKICYHEICYNYCYYKLLIYDSDYF